MNDYENETSDDDFIDPEMDKYFRTDGKKTKGKKSSEEDVKKNGKREKVDFSASEEEEENDEEDEELEETNPASDDSDKEDDSDAEGNFHT